MSTQYSGEPAVEENALPTATNIASTTFATPVVITTATPHGLVTGDYFLVEFADEPNLNNVPLMAGTVTATTVVALASPLGTSIVGTLAGGANGIVKSGAFGLTYAIPSDLTDDMDAVSVNVALEALGNRTALLLWLARFRGVIVDGGRLTISSGPEGGILDIQGNLLLNYTDLLTSEAPAQNQLFPCQILKCSGKFTTDGIGGVTVDGGFNILSATIVGGAIDVTFSGNFANTQYQPMVTSMDGLARWATTDLANSTVSKVRLQVWNNAGAINPATTAVIVSLHIAGTLA